MEDWSLYWCFYNSVAFGNITNIALLGALLLIIPALADLPEKLEPRLGELHTKYIMLDRSRNKTIRFGIYTLLYSGLAVLPYLWILKKTFGQTCSIDITPDTLMVYWLWGIYFCTILGLVSLGLFYRYFQNTKNQSEMLKK